ncbi:hypothetical protein C7212DRAFT_317981 [Tuber magnatum]|uniref:Uncharacterized protein n=1 Tax=Tuber magnatum TaxID=42249 RepID=A0A317SS93_9PEZI|nr:hypothetical protein C7212DRAFT_317981 [Tuber magnatum]
MGYHNGASRSLPSGTQEIAESGPNKNGWARSAIAIPQYSTVQYSQTPNEGPVAWL